MIRLPAAWRAPRRPTAPSLHRLTTRCATATLAGAVLTLAACGGGGGSGGGGVTPPPPDNTVATVTFPTRLTVASGTGSLAVRVTPAYQRTGAAAVVMPVKSVNVSGGGLQQVSVPVDLAACLNDNAHSGGTGVCQVAFEIALLSGSNVLDAVAVPTVDLRGGSSTPLTTVFDLVEVAAVSLAPPPGTATPVRLLVGNTVPLIATVTGANSATLSNRAITWKSDASAIATVDATTGVVSAVGPGQTKIRGAVGTREGVLDVTVVAANAITISAGTGNGRGSVTSTPASLDCTVAPGTTTGTRCSASFAADLPVTLTAKAETGSIFAGWTGDCAAAGTAETCTVTPDQARTVGATFTQANYTITLTVAGTGTGSVSVNVGGVARTACTKANSPCTYQGGANATVTLTGVPSGSNNLFDVFGTTCPGAQSGANPCTFTLTSDVALKGNFTDVSNLRDLTIVASGAGAGRVTGTVTKDGITAFIDCSVSNGRYTSTTGCATRAANGSSITLSATAEAGSTFVGWTGDCAAAGTAATCTVLLDRTRTVGLNFSKP